MANIDQEEKGVKSNSALDIVKKKILRQRLPEFTWLTNEELHPKIWRKLSKRDTCSSF